MGMRWLAGPMVSAILVICLTAAPEHAQSAPTPGIKINDETSFCTSAFTAEGDDGNYYLMTSAHCDAHDGSVWTYGADNAPLGKLVKGEYEETPMDRRPRTYFIIVAPLLTKWGLRLLT